MILIVSFYVSLFPYKPYPLKHMHYFLTVPTQEALQVITAIVNNSHLTKITSIVSKESNTLVFFDSQYTKRYLCCNSGLSVFDYNLQTVNEAYNYVSDTILPNMHDCDGIFDTIDDDLDYFDNQIDDNQEID